MSSSSTQQFMAEAAALGMNLSTPVDDVTLNTPLEVLQASLEYFSVATQAPGTSLEQLEAASTSLTSAPEDNECAICVTELVATDNDTKDNLEVTHRISTAIKLNTCGHVFHNSCLMQWMKESSTCPFCRRKILGGRNPLRWKGQDISWTEGTSGRV